MKSSRPPLAALTIATLAISACESGREALPNTSVFVVHAAPSYLSIEFRREQRLETEPPLEYGGVSAHSFDADQYDFNVDTSPPGALAPVRQATFAATLSEADDHYVILSESGGEIDPVVVAEPAFDPGSADAELSVFHAGPALGDVDVYVEPPGADPAAATPRGSIGHLDGIDPARLPPGEYRVTLTEPGAPAGVVFRSPAFDVGAGQDNMLVIIDDANQSLANAAVVRVAPVSSVLTDVDAPAALRAVNGANDRESKDVVVNGDFDAPLFAGLPFAAAVDYATVPPGSVDVTITPAGDPGVLELEETFTASRAGYHTYLFAGTDSAGLSSAVVREERRPIADTARVRLANGAPQFERLEVLIVEPGASLADASLTPRRSLRSCR